MEMLPVEVDEIRLGLESVLRYYIYLPITLDPTAETDSFLPFTLLKLQKSNIKSEQSR